MVNLLYYAIFNVIYIIAYLYEKIDLISFEKIIKKDEYLWRGHMGWLRLIIMIIKIYE